MQAKWIADSWRCRRLAGDSFATIVSSHLSLFPMSQALAGPWDHRDPAFEEFTDWMSKQVALAWCEEDSGDAGSM